MPYVQDALNTFYISIYLHTRYYSTIFVCIIDRVLKYYAKTAHKNHQRSTSLAFHSFAFPLWLRQLGSELEAQREADVSLGEGRLVLRPRKWNLVETAAV